jgi:hypothetical protein
MRPGSASGSATARDVLGVAGQQRSGQPHEVKHALVGDAVEDLGVAAFALDEATPAQAREVVGDLRLRLAQVLDELADGQLAVLVEHFQYAHARGVGQHREVLGEEVGLGWRGGQPERDL